MELHEGVTLQAWRKSKLHSKERSCDCKHAYESKLRAKCAVKTSMMKGGGEAGIYPCWHERFPFEDGKCHWHIYTKKKQEGKYK